MKGCFEFKIKDKEKIHDIGFRLKIAERIPDDLEGRVENENGFVKVTLQGEEKRVEEFYNKLKEELSGNPTVFLELKPIPDTLIRTDRFFHKLECEQLGKFVDVGLEMRDAIKELPEKLAKAIKEK
jgi:acylphosphatase